MKTKSRKLLSTLLTFALVFGLSAVMPLTASAEDGPFQVTENPIGATYMLNEVAVPLKATFEYDARTQLGTIESDTPIKVQWYWNNENSNTSRSNGFGESTVAYARQIQHTTTITPATDTVGVKYYYAVLSYAESAFVAASGQWDTVPREAVTDPARIEVIAPNDPEPEEYSFEVKKVDEDGNLLSGAVIALTPIDNDFAPNGPAQENTTINGYASFTATEGYYILSEKQAPTGYNAADEKYNIYVSPNGLFFYFATHLEQYETVTFVNKKIPSEPEPQIFRVKKVDEDGKMLAGAVIQLVPENTSGKSYEATTAADGYASFSVTEGYYILSEKQAPTGYNATDEKYNIFVSENGVFIVKSPNNIVPYTTVTFINKEIPPLNKEDHFAFMQGYPDNTFRPERNMTRAEAVVMFSRLLSKSMNVSIDYRNNYYPDVAPTEWYANQVGYMQKLGVLADYSRDGNFRPNDAVTRAEFATLAAHFDNLTLTGTNKFSDVPSGHWAVKYINSAAAKGWITGYPDGTFKPEANITRAEVVTLVGRMLDRFADSEYLTANAGTLPRTFSDLATSHWAYLAIMEASIGHDYIKDGAGEHWTAVYP